MSGRYYYTFVFKMFETTIFIRIIEISRWGDSVGRNCEEVNNLKGNFDHL